MALTEEDLNQVLEYIKAASQGIEYLETVGSLSGVKSLPGQKDDKLVNVPINLLSKPADDAANRANTAVKRVEDLAPKMEEATTKAVEAATKAEAAAEQATDTIGVKVAEIAASLSGATARFSGMVESADILPGPFTEAGGAIMYVRDSKRFAYLQGGKYYADWSVDGIPSVDLYMNPARTAIRADKLYLSGNALYTVTLGELTVFAYCEKLIEEGAFGELPSKDDHTLYLVYEEE